MQRYYKAVEYWAEICAEFFSHPYEMNVKDYRLVEGVIRVSDPTYDFIGSQLTRTQLEKTMVVDPHEPHRNKVFTHTPQLPKQKNARSHSHHNPKKIKS